MKFSESAQVREFRSKLHPEHRRAFKLAFRELAAGRGNVIALEDELEGYYRLRVGQFRVIFCYTARDEIRGMFAEQRKVVYELLRANPEWLLED